MCQCSVSQVHFAFPTPMQSRERTIQKEYICASKLERLITGKTCVGDKRVPAKNSIAIRSLHNALLSWRILQKTLKTFQELSWKQTPNHRFDSFTHHELEVTGFQSAQQFSFRLNFMTLHFALLWSHLLYGTQVNMLGSSGWICFRIYGRRHHLVLSVC